MSPPNHAGDTVVDLLWGAVEACPDRTFVDFSGEAHTYADVWERASTLARGFRAAGVGPGDTVVTMLDNNVDSLAAWYGANLIGAIWVGINTALRGEFLRHVLADAAATLVVCEADVVERFLRIEDELPDGMRLLVRGEAPDRAGTKLAVEALDTYRIEGSDQPWRAGSPGDVSLLVYTSGTTGPSKGCVIGHGYVLNLCNRYVESTGRTPGELNWSSLPMFHFNVLALTITSTVLLRSTAAIAPRFSVSNFWPEIERTGARVVNLLGSMGELIAKMPDTPEMGRCHGQVRFVHGAPFSPEVQRVWRERFGVAEIGGGTYGLTEAVPLTHLASGTASPPGSSGRRNDVDFDVRIVDDDDRELGPGEVGEIVARPHRPNVMFQGYWRRPEATLAACRNLWFHTGDLGRFDDDGFFWFVDRKKDYLRRRGENISSMEVEASYAQHPAIEALAVHAVPSDVGEDDVKITAVLMPGAQLTAEELFEWSKERLPYFALPRYIEFREALPTSATGRVHKYQLRDEGCTPSTWDREATDVTWERR